MKPYLWWASRVDPARELELRDRLAELGRMTGKEPRIWINQAISGPRQIRAVFALRFGLLGVTICELNPVAIGSSMPTDVAIALGRRKRMSWPVFLFQWGRARRSGIISRWYGARLPSARIVSEHPHR